MARDRNQKTKARLAPSAQSQGTPVLTKSKNGEARIEYTIDDVAYQTTVVIVIEKARHFGTHPNGIPDVRFEITPHIDTQRIGVTTEQTQAASAQEEAPKAIGNA